MASLWKPGALVLAALLALAPTAHAEEPKVFLELFTSQGCSSCPSADAFLGELVDEYDDVVALSFHVDYWNYLGWKDRFATSKTTARQQDYAEALGLAYVYTPQLVIDGLRHVTGSDRGAVMAGMDEAKARDSARVAVALESCAPEQLTVALAAADYEGYATIFLAAVDRLKKTAVNAGENRGRELLHHNVVRDFHSVGIWDGDAMTLELAPGASMADVKGRAVLVQEREGSGRILGGDLLWLDAEDGC